MNSVKPLFIPTAGRKARVAIFLSGNGSNAAKLLERSIIPECCYEVVVLVTDAPESSAASRLAAAYNIPLAALDIRKFYAGHGEEKITLDTPRRRELRDLWSDELYRLIEPYQADAGILAGFTSLSNIASRMLCLNVHPGDLTVEEDGVRILAGLHYRPVETAILRGMDSLRSSVIIAQHYSGSKDVDAGPVLGVSAPVAVELGSETVESLRAVASGRSKPPFNDALRNAAAVNIEKLKTEGDHVVLPAVMDEFFKGNYALGDAGKLYFRIDGSWIPVKTVEFFADGSKILRREDEKKKNSVRRRENFLIRFCKYYYTKIIRTPGTPDFVARGWALGVAVGCIVPVFCQLVFAIPLSFVFRCSKIGAIAGTFVTTPPTAIVIYPIQCYVGNLIIGGSLSFEQIKEATAAMCTRGDFDSFLAMGTHLICAFFAGGILWALLMIPLTYFGVRKLVVSYRIMREEHRKHRQRI